MCLVTFKNVTES